MRGRSLRAALLALAWSVSGAWAVGHVLDFALHLDTVHAEEAAEGEPLVASTHGHGHAHPEIFPVAFNGKLPQPVAVVFSGAPEIPHETVRWSGSTQTVPARVVSWIAAASGPRAPPIS
jgi:hypothetical protein